MCEEFGFDPATFLVVHVARFHPMKDHTNLLRAIRRLSAENVQVNFLLVGHGVTFDNQALRDQCNELVLQGSLILAGKRLDTPRLMAAADVAVSSSAWGEGFPNIVGEAMACGTPCVVTDIGDSAHIVGECGLVVTPGNPEALAKAIGELLFNHEMRKKMGRNARQRIREFYTIHGVANTYFDLYQGKLI